jgi:hypothetical protein
MAAFLRMLWSGRDRKPPRESVQERVSWDSESIIAAVHRWVDLFGEPPVAMDWAPAMARRSGRLDLIERASSAGVWPGVTTVQRHFGSWGAAIEAAGFERLSKGTFRNPYTPPPAETRFWRKVKITGAPADCWEWTDKLDRGGYGSLTVRRGLSVRAHRFAYEMLVGPIPEGLHLDHLCRNTNCVNPLHLEAVTPRENSLRSASVTGLNAAKTHCIRGHEFNEANTWIRPNGERECRPCKRMHWRAWDERRKAEEERQVEMDERRAQYSCYPPHRNVMAAPVKPPVKKERPGA